MEWNKETVFYFLNLIRERPVIWDAQCRDYKDKIKRCIAVEEIALLIGCTVKTVNTKWTSLKCQYSREKRSMTGMRTGSGASDIYMTKWYCFKEMESLMDCNKPEHTYNNLSESLSSLPMPQLPSTPTPPLFQPPTTTTPPLQPPNAPTPPLLRPPNAPTPPLMRPPSTPTPPLMRPPSTPTPPLLQLNNTPTPPLHSPPIPPASSKRKKKDRNTVYKEAMDAIKTIREDRATRRNESTINKHDDNITAYGLYIAAQIRMFPPILQSKIKLDIQTLLCKYEMENINYISDSSMSDHPYAVQRVPHASTFEQSDDSIASTSSFRQLDFGQMSENSQPETPSKNIVIMSNDDSSNDSLQPEFPGNSAHLPGLPRIVILPQANRPTQDTETKKAMEYLLKFRD